MISSVLNIGHATTTLMAQNRGAGKKSVSAPASSAA